MPLLMAKQLYQCALEFICRLKTVDKEGNCGTLQIIQILMGIKMYLKRFTIPR